MRANPRPHARTELERPGTAVWSLVAAAFVVALVPTALWLVAHPTATVAVVAFTVGAGVVRAHVADRVRGLLARRRRTTTTTTTTTAAQCQPGQRCKT